MEYFKPSLNSVCLAWVNEKMVWTKRLWIIETPWQQWTTIQRIFVNTSIKWKLPTISLLIHSKPILKKDKKVLQIRTAINLAKKFFTLYCVLANYELITVFRNKTYDMQMIFQRTLNFTSQTDEFFLLVYHISRKRTPSGSRKSIRNWSWPLTRMCKYKVCMS